jgi:hypothetical protein
VAYPPYPPLLLEGYLSETYIEESPRQGPHQRYDIAYCIPRTIRTVNVVHLLFPQCATVAHWSRFVRRIRNQRLLYSAHDMKRDMHRHLLSRNEAFIVVDA